MNTETLREEQRQKQQEDDGEADFETQKLVEKERNYLRDERQARDEDVTAQYCGASDDDDDKESDDSWYTGREPMIVEEEVEQ